MSCRKHSLLVASAISLFVQVSVAATDPPANIKVPLAKKSTDKRTEHLLRRDVCEKQASSQALQGEDYKVFVYRCLQG